ncbi:hypothetical protein [Streptomyces sp. NPDC001876]|uniref:hypothetical protein n=1 Tax=Streptomyces sp. NPDC001876 TaxID=3154402 RepID=UPI0033166933
MQLRVDGAKDSAADVALPRLTGERKRLVSEAIPCRPSPADPRFGDNRDELKGPADGSGLRRGERTGKVIPGGLRDVGGVTFLPGLRQQCMAQVPLRGRDAQRVVGGFGCSQGPVALAKWRSLSGSTLISGRGVAHATFDGVNLRTAPGT